MLLSLENSGAANVELNGPSLAAAAEPGPEVVEAVVAPVLGLLYFIDAKVGSYDRATQEMPRSRALIM